MTKGGKAEGCWLMAEGFLQPSALRLQPLIISSI
jgi:hypothetical protein